MNQHYRQDAIVELVRQNGYVSIEQLTEHFAVTPQTIRRDLNTLAEEGRIRRVHGGAGIESSTVNTAYSTRKTLHLEEKERLKTVHQSVIKWVRNRFGIRKPGGRGKQSAWRAAKTLGDNVVIERMKPLVSDTPGTRVFG